MSETYTVNDLRADMAATIRALRNGDEKMTVDKAKAISDLGQTVINSAKVEVDMLRAFGQRGVVHTGFVPLPKPVDTLDQQEGAGAEGATPRLEGPSGPKPHVRNPMGSAPRGSL